MAEFAQMTGIATYLLMFVALYFEVFLLVTYLDRLGSPENTLVPTARKLPSVTIIVPCYNEESGLEETVHSLRALNYPSNLLHVLIVDDGSTDKTLEIARRLETSVSPSVSTITKLNGGKYTAMNLALDSITTDLVGCLDADSTVSPSALTNAVKAFQNPQVSAVTPGIHAKNPQTLLQFAQAAEYRLAIFNRFIFAALGSAFITPGPFSIFRTRVVKQLGGWRYAHSSEDMELALRMQEQGFLIGNAPQAAVHTTTPKTIRLLFRQRVRWAYGFLRNAVDYRHMFGSEKYGNLGIMILPCALISIFAALFFYARLVFSGTSQILSTYAQISAAQTMTVPTFNIFYVNSSALIFIIYSALAISLLFMIFGNRVSNGRFALPLGTPLFLALYFILVPLWLSTALIKATFNTGVRWK